MKKLWIVIIVLMASLSTVAVAAPLLSYAEYCQLAEDDLRITQQGNQLVVEQTTGGSIMIYSALGRCVYQGSGTHIQVQLQPGIYVIRTASKTVKFVVK